MIENSRRIDTRIAGLFCFLFVFLYPLQSREAPKQVFSVNIQNHYIYTSATFVLDNADELINNLKSGFRAEITFQFRLYEKQSGLLSFLGNRLIKEIKITKSAWYDIFEGAYVIESKGLEVGRFKKKDNFLTNFLSINYRKLIIDSKCRKGSCILMGRVYFVPIKLIAPLNLVRVFTPLGSTTTEWQEIQLEKLK